MDTSVTSGTELGNNRPRDRTYNCKYIPSTQNETPSATPTTMVHRILLSRGFFSGTSVLYKLQARLQTFNWGHRCKCSHPTSETAVESVRACT